MSYLEEILAESTSCIGFIGQRGASKTWTAQFILEMLALRGWHPLIIDVKGEDETLHLPARDKQAIMLKSEGLEPRGWKTAYYTFCFPLAMESIPMHFQLASLSVKMLSFGHFRTLGGFLSPGEARDLFDAYISAGGPDAKLEEILTKLITKRRNPSPRAVSLLTSGFLSDFSVLEPYRLLEIVERHEFTVLSNAYFAPSSRDLGRFALNVVLDNLMGYLVQAIETARIIVHLRELREVAPRAGAVGSQWHLKERIENFVTLLRQTRTALSRVFYEVQNVQSVPKTLLDNTSCVFVHPFNLKQDAQRREIERYFDIPDKILHAIAPMKDVIPGKWVFLTKSGSADLVTAPPPMSLRIPEPSSPEEAEELRKLYNRIVPRRELREELERAKARYEFWMSKHAEKKEKKQVKQVKAEIMELPPPETFILERPSFPITMLVTTLHKVLDGRNEEKVLLLRDDLTQPLFDIWGSDFIRKHALWPSHLLDKSTASLKSMVQLKVMGIKVWQDPGTKKWGLEIDMNRFRRHMNANATKWKTLLEEYMKEKGYLDEIRQREGMTGHEGHADRAAFSLSLPSL